MERTDVERVLVIAVMDVQEQYYIALDGHWEEESDFL